MAMSLGDEICTYLQSAVPSLNFNGVGTINLFSSLLPDQPNLACAVIERGGLPPIMWLTGSPPVNESRQEQPTFQIRFRSSMTGYTAGNTLVQQVFSALQGVTQKTLNPGGSLFNLITAQQTPVYLGRDDKERHQWSQNYFVIWVNDQRTTWS